MSVARRSTRHTGIVCAALLVAVAAAVVASLFVGSRAVPANEVLLVLRGAGTAEIRGIVWDLRVPRTLIAFAVGASLALAGALAQAWTRNPLADPGFIGITAGASCAMAIGAVLGVSATVTGSLTFAFGGAAAATGVVMLIARRSLSPLTLILAGVGVDAALRSVLAGLNPRGLSLGDVVGLFAASRGLDDAATDELAHLLGAADTPRESPADSPGKPKASS